MKVKSESEVAQSCPTPSDPMDYSLPGFSVHGIFQARVLEWRAIAFSAVIEEDVYKTISKAFFFFFFKERLFGLCICTAAAAAAAAASLQSCPTLCDPIDGSPACSAIPGILQARTLEWVAILSPLGSACLNSMQSTS